MAIGATAAGLRRPSNLRGEVAGGLACAILTLPGSAGLGILALTPLGPDYVAHGILAGLYTAIILPLAALALGSRTNMMFSTRSVLTFLITTFVLQSLAGPRAGIVDLADVPRTLTVLFFVIFVAGLFQAAFGAFRLGNLVRYIPSPVMAGFQNAGAILIFVSQVDALLGFSQHVPLSQIPAAVDSVQWLTLLVGLITAVVMWHAERITSALPPAAIGLVAGSAAYYAIAGLGFGAHLGAVIGPIPVRVPAPSYLAGFAGLFTEPGRWHLLAVVAGGAFSLAILSSLDALLSAKACDQYTGTRTDGARTLVQVGVGNMAVASFGGITGSVNLLGTAISHQAGARSPLSVLVCAVTVLIAVLVLPPVIALIPRVVIAGMLMVFSVQLFDAWTIEMVHKVITRQVPKRRRLALDLFVIALVATAAIAVNLVTAVGIGILVAILSFLFRMSRSVIRRTYRGDVVRSRRTLEPRLMDVLSADGRRILVLELEGALFFGTAEDLAKRVEAATEEDVTYVILDLNRVSEVDSTGARILLQLHERLQKDGRHLLLSHLHADAPATHALTDVGVIAAVTERKVFGDTDRALEWAEDQLLRARDPRAEGTRERPLEEMDALAGLARADCAVLGDLLIRRAYRRGDVVFREGDEGRELFLIARGAASAKLRLARAGRENRLATFSAGTVFGELALLDPGPRSASIEAEDDLVCYVLTEAAFERLRAEHPHIAITLLTNLGRELGRRLRRANGTIYQLEG